MDAGGLRRLCMYHRLPVRRRRQQTGLHKAGLRRRLMAECIEPNWVMHLFQMWFGTIQRMATQICFLTTKEIDKAVLKHPPMVVGKPVLRQKLQRSHMVSWAHQIHITGPLVFELAHHMFGSRVPMD